MSISKVEMKLANVWEYGQAYVGKCSLHLLSVIQQNLTKVELLGLISLLTSTLLTTVQLCLVQQAWQAFTLWISTSKASRPIQRSSNSMRTSRSSRKKKNSSEHKSKQQQGMLSYCTAGLGIPYPQKLQLYIYILLEHDKNTIVKIICYLLRL